MLNADKNKNIQFMMKFRSKSLLLIFSNSFVEKCRYFDPFKVYLTVQLVCTMSVLCTVYVHVLLYTVVSNYTSTLTLLVACTRDWGTRKTCLSAFSYLYVCVCLRECVCSLLPLKCTVNFFMRGITIKFTSHVYSVVHIKIYQGVRKQTQKREQKTDSPMLRHIV